jgi:hypothetical protein
LPVRLTARTRREGSMTESPAMYDANAIGARILTVRDQKVILDTDLAFVYGVEVRRLNEQVKRNSARFPEDFAFTLTSEEWEHISALRSQNAILKRGSHRKYLPRVFTEHGAIMAANVLNSTRATEMSVFVVRAFVRMRSALSDTRELARKLAALEREVKARLDTHDAAIVDILARIMDMIDPPAFPEPPRKRIGFGACPTKPSGRSRVKEKRAKYTTRKRSARTAKKGKG